MKSVSYCRFKAARHFFDKNSRYLNHFQNSVSFENGFGKTGFKAGFSPKSMVAFSKTEVLKKPHLLIPAVLSCIIFFGSCTPKIIAEQFTSQEKTEELVITALIPEENRRNAADQKNALETQVVTRLVLESGNYWTRGIPGFGENALSAFLGEYRVPDKTETVKVWLTMEFLYYEGWKNQESISGVTVLEKAENNGRIIAFILNDFWTAILLLPTELVLNGEEENRIITGFINKFRDFSGQGQNISLPAFIPY